MNQTTKKQNPLVFYVRMFLYMVLAVLVRAAAFAPLWFLTREGGVKWLALLCPALLLLVVLPLRYSFAEAVVQRPGERCFTFGAAFSFARYGEKLGASLLHALHVIKWGIPLFAMLGYAYYWYTGVDALTVLQTVTELGQGWTNLWTGIQNLLGIEAAPAANAMMDGVLVVLFVLGLGILIWLYGAMRNSASRYLWVLANRQDADPRKEARRCLRGRRFAQLLVALVNLVLWVPFVLVSAKALKGVVNDLASVLMMAVVQGSLPAMDLASVALPLVAAFVGLYLTILPVRRWLTACFAVRENRRHTARKVQA